MLKATICFRDDFAEARLNCQARTQRVLLQRCKDLILECGIKPRLMDDYHQDGFFVVMFVRGNDGEIDHGMTRQIQFDLYDWMERK